MGALNKDGVPVKSAVHQEKAPALIPSRSPSAETPSRICIQAHASSQSQVLTTPSTPYECSWETYFLSIQIKQEATWLSLHVNYIA